MVIQLCLVQWMYGRRKAAPLIQERSQVSVNLEKMEAKLQKEVDSGWQETIVIK